MMSVRAPLAALGFIVLLAACDSAGDPADEKDKGGTIDERLEKAQEAMEEAQKLGADQWAAKDFEYQKEKLDQAKELIDSGKGDKARSKVSAAERGFKDLIRKASDISKEQKGALEAKKKADQAVATAKSEKVDEHAKEEFEEIQTTIAKALADAESRDQQKIAAAVRAYGRIPDMVQRARQIAKENRSWKDKSDTQKKAVLQAEAKAKEAKADQFAVDDLTRAQQAVREGDSEVKEGRYREAYDRFRAAETIFVDAMTRSREQEALNKSLQPTEVVDTTDVNKKPDTAKAEAPPPEDTPKVEPVPVQPGEISVEDEMFLQENIKAFAVKSIPMEYNSSTGEFTVEYAFGDQLRRDLLFPRGPIPDKHITWKDVIGGLDSKKAEGKKELGLTFSGNTNGFFLLPYPFKDKVELEYRVEIGLMKNEGTMSSILMSSDDGKSYLAANFGTIEYYRDGRRMKQQPPADPKKLRSPNYWFDKTKQIAVKVTYEVAEDGKGATMAIWYDLDEEPDAPICQTSVPARGGQVGFNWFATKFNIRELKISGKLDKQAAVAFLRKKLSKAAPGAAPAGKAKAGAGKAGKGDGEAAKPEGGAPAAKPAAEKAKAGKKKTGDGEEEADY